MPVFVDGEHFLPWKTAQVKAVLLRRQLEFASERSQLHIAICNRGLVLEDDIYLALRLTDRRKGSLAETLNDGGHLLRGGIQPGRKYDPRRVRIDLLPFQRGGGATKLLGG